MLGDSELEETMHDILVLLSGIGADVSRVLDYYRQMSTPLHADVPEHVVFNDVAINFTGKWGPKFGPWLRSHRITEATCPSIGFSLHHRFTGHRVVYENGEGVAGLLYYLKSEEARAVELANCDIFVLNSASHDFLACRASHGLEVLSKDEHGVAKACLDSHLERLAQALAAAAANSSTLFGPSPPPPVPSSSASPPPPPPLLLRKQFAYWKGGNFEAMGGAQPSPLTSSVTGNRASPLSCRRPTPLHHTMSTSPARLSNSLSSDTRDLCTLGKTPTTMRSTLHSSGQTWPRKGYCNTFALAQSDDCSKGPMMSIYLPTCRRRCARACTMLDAFNDDLLCKTFSTRVFLSQRNA